MSYRDRYGPWALIAGASEGTGAAFARRTAAEGIHCILVARRAAPLDALASELRAATGIECVTATIDLAAADAGDRLAAVAGPREIGLLVANAGADEVGAPFLDQDVADWEALATRNVLTVVRASHLFGGQMRARGRGGILIVNSGACYGGIPGIAVYAGTKAFGLCFAEALWAELRPHGVDVLSLVLGQTDTPAYRAFLAKKGQPVPDGIARPEDVARIGLERLEHGPVHNWGLADDDPGYAGHAAAARRARILAIAQAMGGAV